MVLRYTDPEPMVSDDMVISRPVFSRKSPNVGYSYAPQYKGSDITVQSPVLFNWVVLDNNRKIRFDLSTSDDGGVFHDLLASVGTAVQESLAGVKWPAEWDSYLLQSFGTRTEVVMGISKDLAVFSSKDKSILTEDVKGLTDRPVRFIAKLDGLYIHQEGHAGGFVVIIKQVWTVTQLLVYPEVSLNPLGKQYCFLDDAEYDSLEEPDI